MDKGLGERCRLLRGARGKEGWRSAYGRKLEGELLPEGGVVRRAERFGLPEPDSASPRDSSAGAVQARTSVELWLLCI